VLLAGIAAVQKQAMVSAEPVDSWKPELLRPSPNRPFDRDKTDGIAVAR